MITSIVQAAGIALIVGLLVGAVTAWSLTGSYKDAKMDTLVATHAAQIATLKAALNALRLVWNSLQINSVLFKASV